MKKYNSYFLKFLVFGLVGISILIFDSEISLPSYIRIEEKDQPEVKLALEVISITAARG